MKKIRILASFLCLCLLISVFPIVSHATQGGLTAQDVPPKTATSESLPMLGTEELVSNCTAAFLCEVETGTVMYAWNADVPQDPASFSKLMTALIAIEEAQMLDMVTVSKSAVESVPGDAVSAHLQEGEVLHLQELLYCMLVGSANDAAAVIAEHVSGSQEAFVERMNRRAVELGCTNTFFKNPHGLYDPEQTMTARDAAKILSAGMENEMFAGMIGTVEHTVPSTNMSEVRNITTGNYLMSQEDVQVHYDSRVIGGRTGIAGDGTRCIASVAQTDELLLACIIMGSKNEYKEDGKTTKVFGGYPETKFLLDACFDNYERINLLFENQTLKQCATNGGNADVVIGPKTSVKTVLPVGATSKDLIYRYTDVPGALIAPIQKGDHISDVAIWYGNYLVGQAELFAMNSVDAVAATETHQEPDAPGQKIDRATWKGIGIGIAAVVAALVLILMIRNIRIAAARKRIRQRRKNRRRSR